MCAGLLMAPTSRIGTGQPPSIATMSKFENHWSAAEIAGHACEVFRPSKANPHGFVVIYLHGVHQTSLRDKDPFNKNFEAHGLTVVAPRSGATWWADRLTPHFDDRLTPQSFVRDKVMEFIENEFDAVPPRVALLGTSMGGQGALRISYQYPDRFPIVAALSPAIDYQIRIQEGDEILTEMYGDPERGRQDTALLHVFPLNWPRHQFFCCDPLDYRWFDSSDRLKMKLGSMGIPHETDLETSAGGHGFEYYNAMAERAVDFLADALERERLRIV